jgi:ubiquinone/menaquinone biosynthesis C-methylase UbiE
MTRLAEWNLLGLDLTVLDIGCGIGRIDLALAPLVGMITAIDTPPHDRRGAAAVSRPGKRKIPPV